MFVQHSQERIMGLLGSIITLDEQYDAELNMMLTTIDFLKFIFYFARYITILAYIEIVDLHTFSSCRECSIIIRPTSIFFLIETVYCPCTLHANAAGFWPIRCDGMQCLVLYLIVMESRIICCEDK